MANIENGANIMGVNSNGSANVLLYDGAGNPIPRLNGAVSSDYGQQMMAVNDRVSRLVRSDRFGNLGVALHTPLFAAEFEGTTLNAQQWTITQTTFVGAQTQGQYNQNNTNLTTIGAVSALQTQMRFKKMQQQPLHAKFRHRGNVVANSQLDLGFFLTTGAGQIANGAYFQITSGGVFGVITFNSSDVTPVSLGALNVVLPNTNEFYTFDILLDDDEARFVVQRLADEAILGEATVRVPNLLQRMWQDTHLPFTSRVWNNGTPASAPVSILTDLMVTGVDAASQRTAGQTAALFGLSNAANPQTGAQLSTFANSAAPANATLSNTAAGYATLDGLFSFVGVAGAATDYALFALQMPATHDFVCTGINIDVWNTGATGSATVPTLLEWFIQPNASALSLATAATRHHLGTMVIPINAVAGAMADRSVSRSFEHAPLVTFAGRFQVIALRMPVGAVTASQVIQGAVAVRGYFE